MHKIKFFLKIIFLFTFIACFFSPESLKPAASEEQWRSEKEFQTLLESVLTKKNAIKESHNISDEEFWDLLSTIEEIKTEAAKPVKKINKKKFKTSVVTNAGYFLTNKKPASLLFSKDDSGYDYQQHGYNSDVTVNLSRNFKIKSGYLKKISSEYDSEAVSLERIDTTITQKLFGGDLNCDFASYTLPTQQTGNNEYGLGYNYNIGQASYGFNMARKIYAADADSYKYPSKYNKFNAKTGYELSNELYLEVVPSYESYYQSTSAKKQVITDLFYSPCELPNVSLDIYYLYFAYSNKENTEKSALFSTGKGATTGLGINYTMKVLKRSNLNFGLNIDREKYFYNEKTTQYYIASAFTGLNLKLRPNYGLKLNYGFSVSQSSGYPFTQNMKLNLNIKF